VVYACAEPEAVVLNFQALVLSFRADFGAAAHAGCACYNALGEERQQ
jgi:hypothetical protein